MQLFEQRVDVLIDHVRALVDCNGLLDGRAVGLELGGKLRSVQALCTGDGAVYDDRNVTHCGVIGQGRADGTGQRAGGLGCDTVLELGHGGDGLELVGELGLHHLFGVHDQNGLGVVVPADRSAERLRGKANGDIGTTAFNEGCGIGGERTVGACPINRACLAADGQLDRAVTALGGYRAGRVVPGDRRAHRFKDGTEGDKGTVVAHEGLGIREGDRLVVQGDLDTGGASAGYRECGYQERGGECHTAQTGK